MAHNNVKPRKPYFPYCHPVAGINESGVISGELGPIESARLDDECIRAIACGRLHGAAEEEKRSTTAVSKQSQLSEHKTKAREEYSVQ